MPLIAFGRWGVLAVGLLQVMTTSALIGLMWSIPQSHKAHAPQLSSSLPGRIWLGPLLGRVVWHNFQRRLCLVICSDHFDFAVLCFIGLLHLYTEFAFVSGCPSPDMNTLMQNFILQGWLYSVSCLHWLFASSSLISFILIIQKQLGPLISGLAITCIC